MAQPSQPEEKTGEAGLDLADDASFSQHLSHVMDVSIFLKTRTDQATHMP